MVMIPRSPGQLTYFRNLVNHVTKFHDTHYQIIMMADVLTIFHLLGQGWTRAKHFLNRFPLSRKWVKIFIAKTSHIFTLKREQ